jgi:alpha,alpha-trehalose-phosphate synthase [UDP-forming]
MDRGNQLIIVSNRLPVQIEKNADASLTLKPSSGGLVTAVQPVAKQTDARWMGFLGFELNPDLQRQLEAQGFEAIELSEELYEPYYSGYCNATLWPLMHYFTQTATFDHSTWDAYLRINQQFAEAIAQKAPLDARVWVHDYHLMVLPSLLKRLRPDLFISYFHHIPFPAPDVFTMLPQAATIVDSLAQCDHVGFHTQNYADNFKAATGQLMNAKVTPLGIRHMGHTTLVSAHPISIDFDEFDQLSRNEIANPELQCLAASEYKIVLGVDRMDYTKGIKERLEGFRHFLQHNPEWVGKIILLQICVPSRNDVPSYRRLRQKIEQLVGEINGEFGTPDYTPIHYFFQSVPRPDLVAMYKIADTMLVTSLRDGMNLVSKEYIAANSHERGVLILSKFAGSALELKDALFVNPYDSRNISESLREALNMPITQRRQRMVKLRKVVREGNQRRWCQGIFQQWAKAGALKRVKPQSLQSVS